MTTKNMSSSKKISAGKILDPPNPLPIRKCECGCGTEFQPRRSDQRFVTGKHADFAYNNTIRKEKNSVVRQIQKILLRNDKILSKYFGTSKDGKEAICYLLNLEADGFNIHYHTGSAIVANDKYFFMYKYKFITYQNNQHLHIKILRR